MSSDVRGLKVQQLVAQQTGKLSGAQGQNLMETSSGGRCYPSKGENMKKLLILVVVATLMVASCSGMTTTQQRVLSGGAIGAGGGALVGWAAGNPALGAAVGAGAGALGGVLYDQYEKSRGSP